MPVCHSRGSARSRPALIAPPEADDPGKSRAPARNAPRAGPIDFARAGYLDQSASIVVSHICRRPSRSFLAPDSGQCCANCSNYKIRLGIVYFIQVRLWNFSGSLPRSANYNRLWRRSSSAVTQTITLRKAGERAGAKVFRGGFINRILRFFPAAAAAEKKRTAMHAGRRPRDARPSSSVAPPKRCREDPRRHVHRRPPFNTFRHKKLRRFIGNS